MGELRFTLTEVREMTIDDLTIALVYAGDVLRHRPRPKKGATGG
jgi:hypothetical protein